MIIFLLRGKIGWGERGLGVVKSPKDDNEREE